MVIPLNLKPDEQIQAISWYNHSNHFSMVTGVFCRGHELQKNIRQHLQHFPPLQRLSCVSCRALRKKPSLSVCLVYYSFIRSHSQDSSFSFMYLALLTFSFMTWNCPFCIFTRRNCYYTYIQITICKDTFLLYNIFITTLGVQMSLLGGTGFVQLARSALTGEWEMFSSAVGICWMLFLKSHSRHRSQRLPLKTTVNVETATIVAIFIQNYWYPCQSAKF